MLPHAGQDLGRRARARTGRPGPAVLDLAPSVLRADPEIPEALGRRVLVARREQARVQGREHAHGSRRAAVHRLAAGHPQDLLLADSVPAQHAGAFRRTDDHSPGRAGDAAAP